MPSRARPAQVMLVDAFARLGVTGWGQPTGDPLNSG